MRALISLLLLFLVGCTARVQPVIIEERTRFEYPPLPERVTEAFELDGIKPANLGGKPGVWMSLPDYLEHRRELLQLRAWQRAAELLHKRALRQPPSAPKAPKDI